MGHESLHDLFQPRSRVREKETAWKRNWLFPLSHVTGMESRFYSPLQLRISRNTLCLYPPPPPPKEKMLRKHGL